MKERRGTRYKKAGQMPQNDSLRKEMIHRFSDDASMTEAIRQAVREAVLEHKRVGNPVADWQDGRVVIVPPEEIRLDEVEEKKPPPESFNRTDVLPLLQ